MTNKNAKGGKVWSPADAKTVTLLRCIPAFIGLAVILVVIFGRTVAS